MNPQTSLPYMLVPPDRQPPLAHSDSPPASHSEPIARRPALLEISLQLAAKHHKRQGHDLRLDEPAEIIKASARWFARFYNPYTVIEAIFVYGLSSEAGTLERVYVGRPASERAEAAKAFAAMRNSTPAFSKLLEQLFDNATMIESAKRLYSEAASQARSEDVSSLKKTGFVYFEPNIPLKDRKFDPVRFEDRAARGFNAVEFARLLCPHRLSSIFDIDPEGFLAKVQNGTIIVNENDYPCMFYDGPYDAENIGAGLLRSPVLVLIFKHIYTSPSSASASGRRTRSKGQAGIYSITTVSGRMIAYSAMHYRHMCTSAPFWSVRTGSFDNAVMFDNITSLFERNPADPWAVETLAWWNAQVFGPQDPAIALPTDAAETDHARFLAQRMQGSTPGGV